VFIFNFLEFLKALLLEVAEIPTKLSFSLEIKLAAKKRDYLKESVRLLREIFLFSPQKL
jgi:hypothetical protein